MQGNQSDNLKKAMNPYKVLFHFLPQKILDKLDDSKYLRLIYRAQIGRRLNLNNPIAFTEKLQWLKLYDRKPIYCKMVDKFEAKQFVSERIGQEYTIPTLGVWDCFDDIDFGALPEQFVLKCTHDSGGLCICYDKREFDYKTAEIRLTHSLNTDYFLSGREWPYKDVKHRIICEPLIHDASSGSSTNEPINDYKFFCFNEKVKFFKVDFDRFTDHHANYYDTDGKLLPFGEMQYLPKPERKIEIPPTLGKMIELSEILAKDTKFLRVDFYYVNKKIYFGELTFFPASGLGSFYPEEWDAKIGEMLSLE